MWSQEVLIPLAAYHEGGPPPAIPDLVSDSYPRLVTRALMQSFVQYIGSLDKCVRSALLLKFLHPAISQGATR